MPVTLTSSSIRMGFIMLLMQYFVCLTASFGLPVPDGLTSEPCEKPQCLSVCEIYTFYSSAMSFLPSKKFQDAKLVAGKGGSDYEGFIFYSMPHVTSFNGAKGVDVIRIRESLTSHNERAENDVYLWHLPRFRVLQEIY